jgi:acetylornithine/succinyldiaminopimelate/putrescine aminotransferase
MLRKLATTSWKNSAEISSTYEIRGKGLMIGIEFKFPIKELRNKLLV